MLVRLLKKMMIIGEKETISFTYFLHQFSWQPSKEYINFCLDLLINHGWNLFTNMGCPYFVWEGGGGIIQRKVMDYLFTMEESRSITN